jgi:hypothetical protein
MSDINTFQNAWNALCLAWDSLNGLLPLEAVDRPEEGDKRQDSDIEDIVKQFVGCTHYITKICNFATPQDQNDSGNCETVTAILNGEKDSENLGLQALWQMLAENFEQSELQEKGWNVIAENLNTACTRLATSFGVQNS